MDEGVKNQEKELDELRKEKENSKETSKTKIINSPEGVTRLDTENKKIDKHKRIEETAQRDEKIHKEFL